MASYELNDKTCGSDVDIVARKFLKQIGLDYAHGTGHGVGYYMNVHEGPQAISKNNKSRLHGWHEIICVERYIDTRNEPTGWYYA